MDHQVRILEIVRHGIGHHDRLWTSFVWQGDARYKLQHLLYVAIGSWRLIFHEWQCVALKPVNWRHVSIFDCAFANRAALPRRMHVQPHVETWPTEQMAAARYHSLAGLTEANVALEDFTKRRILNSCGTKTLFRCHRTHYLGSIESESASKRTRKSLLTTLSFKSLNYRVHPHHSHSITSLNGASKWSRSIERILQNHPI
nr:uncharacterized protein LOC112282039 [Physcomitrium patens]|eukprot:XP_024374931.1 uncharacterized protein LOC112282039 [Physcomitrella patens]